MRMNICGINIHYTKRGSGNPLLFVHGWGGSLNSLTPLSSLFVNTHQVILLDLPGFGESELPGPKWGSFDYAELIAQFIQKLGVDDVIYFGHSFGGSLGIILSTTYPKFVHRLILCNSAYKRTDKKSNIASSLKRFLYSLPVVNHFAPFLRQLGYMIFFRNSDLRKFPTLESNFKKIMSEDLTSLLSMVHIPTLILWGEEDRQTPVSLAYELKSKINNSKLKIYKEKRHNLPLSEPQLVAQEIRTFINI